MDESTIKINKKMQGGVCILELDGSLDAKTTTHLNSELKATIGGGTNKIICNLKNLKYIASAGIGALFANLKESKKGGGDLRLACASKEIMDVFDLLNFTAAFKITSSVEDALKGF